MKLSVRTRLRPMIAVVHRLLLPRYVCCFWTFLKYGFPDFLNLLFSFLEEFEKFLRKSSTCSTSSPFWLINVAVIHHNRRIARNVPLHFLRPYTFSYNNGILHKENASLFYLYFRQSGGFWQQKRRQMLQRPVLASWSPKVGLESIFSGLLYAFFLLVTAQHERSVSYLVRLLVSALNNNPTVNENDHWLATLYDVLKERNIGADTVPEPPVIKMPTIENHSEGVSDSNLRNRKAFYPSTAAVIGIVGCKKCEYLKDLSARETLIRSEMETYLKDNLQLQGSLFHIVL